MCWTIASVTCSPDEVRFVGVAFSTPGGDAYARWETCVLCLRRDATLVWASNAAAGVAPRRMIVPYRNVASDYHAESFLHPFSPNKRDASWIGVLEPFVRFSESALDYAPGNNDRRIVQTDPDFDMAPPASGSALSGLHPRRVRVGEPESPYADAVDARFAALLGVARGDHPRIADVPIAELVAACMPRKDHVKRFNKCANSTLRYRWHVREFAVACARASFPRLVDVDPARVPSLVVYAVRAYAAYAVASEPTWASILVDAATSNWREICAATDAAVAAGRAVDSSDPRDVETALAAARKRAIGTFIPTRRRAATTAHTLHVVRAPLHMAERALVFRETRADRAYACLECGELKTFVSESVAEHRARCKCILNALTKPKPEGKKKVKLCNLRAGNTTLGLLKIAFDARDGGYYCFKKCSNSRKKKQVPCVAQCVRVPAVGTVVVLDDVAYAGCYSCGVTCRATAERLVRSPFECGHCGPKEPT